MRFDVVVAADEAGGIGNDGKLPWRLPGDTAFFKQVTTEAKNDHKRNAVVMGRKTWETIPNKWRPLKDRLNVVLTRQTGYVANGAVVAAGLEEGLAAAAAPDVETVFVIGGGEIYRLAVAMPDCRRVYLTRVEGTFDCDAFFPDLGDDYRLTRESERRVENGMGYVFQTWERNG